MWHRVIIDLKKFNKKTIQDDILFIILTYNPTKENNNTFLINCKHYKMTFLFIIFTKISVLCFVDFFYEEKKEKTFELLTLNLKYELWISNSKKKVLRKIYRKVYLKTQKLVNKYQNIIIKYKTSFRMIKNILYVFNKISDQGVNLSKFIITFGATVNRQIKKNW